MRRILIVSLAALALVACEKKVQPIESAETLAANPGRLRTLRQACKADHAKVGDAQCNAVAEATRQRFLGQGQSPYAADPVKPAPPPAAPAAAASASSVKD